MHKGLLGAVLAATVAFSAPAMAENPNATILPKDGEQVTFSKHISRLIANNCQECHRPGAIGPFSLENYRQVRGWSKMIREVVDEGRMPPWFADAEQGHFANDARLTDDEKKMLFDWIDNGMPRGDAADMPAPLEWEEGWAIGKPDMIFEMPEEAVIPATGVVPYHYYTTETNFKEDVWVEAVESRPGNPKVLHHIIMFVQDPNAQGGDGQYFLDSFAPGGRPFEMGNGLARRIAAGSKLVWQVHYTPTGKVERDRSQFGIRFHRGEVKRELRTLLAANTSFTIPPRHPNYAVEAEYTFPEAARVYSFTPHMHYRGKDAKFKLIFPDGNEKVTLNVPNYDFNWQLDYRLAEPIDVPAGTKMHVVAHFDNSEGNPYNPDPDQAVRWGEQTWEEMMLMGAFAAWDVEPGQGGIPDDFEVGDGD